MIQSDISLFLEKTDLFNNSSKEEIEIYSKIFTPVSFLKNNYLWKQGDERQSLYIIFSGTIELFDINSIGIENRIAVLGSRDYIGEASLLDNDYHITSARCLEDSILLKLTRKDFTDFLMNNQEIGLRLLSKITRIIARRLKLNAHRSKSLSAQYNSSKSRIEHDLLGEREVPDEFYYGIQSQRAIENFNISGISINHYSHLITSLAQVKSAAARANYKLGLISKDIFEAIEQACSEIISGRWHNQFLVDAIQGGAGTSTNMNANEVIANRALVIMGHKRGEYEYCHPNNHVNLSQSTNDAYPTALKIGIIYGCNDLIEYLKQLIESFRNKAREFTEVIKMGRTQLQDAVPMTLGQEFEAYAATLDEEPARLESNSKLFLEINLGGTAIGTGVNAPKEYPELSTKFLSEITGLDLKVSPNLIEATMDTGSYVMFSSAVKRLAVKLSKICNDLRLLSSGPRAGFGEINLPPMQPGSSIMPGKVNPVIPEVVNQIAFKVIGNDLTVTLAAEAGQLELNVMEPVIAQSIFESLEILKNGILTLKLRCIDGITANKDRCLDYVRNSISVVTFLNPLLGYDKTSELSKEALSRNCSLYDLVLEKKLLDKNTLDKILRPENMI